MTRQNLRFLTIAASLLVTTSLLAHSGATGLVKKRMDAMKSIGAEMKVLGAMFRGKHEFDAARVQAAGKIIAEHARKTEKMFPKGSDHKPTRALAEVWKNKPEFDALTKKLVTAAQTLTANAAKAQTIGDIKNDLISVGGTCKACHKKFRAPEE